MRTNSLTLLCKCQSIIDFNFLKVFLRFLTRDVHIHDVQYLYLSNSCMFCVNNEHNFR